VTVLREDVSSQTLRFEGGFGHLKPLRTTEGTEVCKFFSVHSVVIKTAFEDHGFPQIGE